MTAKEMYALMSPLSRQVAEMYRDWGTPDKDIAVSRI